MSLLITLVPAFTGLAWLIDGRPRLRGAAAIGWAFGVGHFAVGLHWIYNAFQVQAAVFGWMAPFAVAFLSAGLALFPMVAVMLAWRFATPGASRVLMLAGTWVALEWLRGVVLTGFPWNLAGSVWVAWLPMMQPAAWIGIHGLSLLTVAIAAAPAVMDGRRRGWLAPALAAVVLVVWWGAGSLRLAGAETGEVDGVRLRLVQGGIPQQDKWRADLREPNFDLLLGLSRRPPPEGAPPPTHVIWAETAATFFLEDDPEHRRALAEVAPAGGALITGTPRRTPPGEPLRLYNAIMAILPDASIAAVYDKSHLVPFGEYLPLRELLSRVGLDKLAAGATDFIPGEGGNTLDTVPGLPPFAALVCYEIIFPGAVVEADADPAPSWILNLTNDAWFGRSSGPWQHLAAARMRAVEEGLPVVRVANTGITTVIGPYGALGPMLGIGARGVLDAGLPRPTENGMIFRDLRAFVPLTIFALVILGSRMLASGGVRTRGERTAQDF